MIRILPLAILIGICSFGAYGQVGTANNSSLISLLDKLQQEHQVTFSYSPMLLKSLTLTQAGSGLTLDETLDYISSRLPLEFEKVGQQGILVIPIRNDLQFKVQDAADGTPINLIYVKINQSKQKHLIAKGDVFILENTFITDALEITTSFYHSQHFSVSDINKQNNLVTLNQETTDLGEVTVLSYLTSGVNSKLNDHSMEVDMNNLGLIAGETDGDILQVLQAIPGIRSPNGKPGSLNLRGSPFDQNLIYFDNIPIYHTGHFFGTISPYNPGIVDKITVHKGVLPAQYGGRVGGLINIETGNSIPEQSSFGALVNMLYTGLEIKAPLIKNRLALTFSARTSYLDGLSPKLSAYYDLNFQGSRINANATDSGNNLRSLNIDFSDINGKLVYEINPNQKLSFSYLSIVNDFGYEFRSPNQNRLETEKTDLDNWGFTAQWNGQLSERLEASVSYTQSSLEIIEDQLDLQGNMATDEENVQNTIDDTRFAISLNTQLGKSSNLRVGYEYVDHDLTTIHRPRPGQAPSELILSNAVISSFHANLEHRIGEKFITNIGLRTDNYVIQNRSRNYLDPRITLTYLASKNLFLKTSGGSAHQYLKQNFANDFDDFRIQNQFWILSERDIPVVSASQFMIGALYDKSSWLIDLEIYRKNIRNISRPGTQAEPNQIGDLSTWGADVLIKKRWDKLETWASYSLGRTRESIRQEQDAYNDQRHVLNIKVLVPLGRWNLAASWGLMSGLPVYLPDPNEIDGPGGNTIATLYSGRFPTQHQLDLSATYQFSKPTSRWRGVLGFSILNAYDHTNVINIFQQNVSVNDPIRHGLGFSPNIQVKISF